MSEDMLSRREEERYARLTAVIKNISILLSAIKVHLPWYIQKTRELTILTEPRTGVSGDHLQEMAQKLSECLPVIEKMVERARELEKQIDTAKMN